MAGYNNPQALLAQILSGGNGDSGKNNRGSRNVETITADDGTYKIGNSPNRLARGYMTPDDEQSGAVMAWRLEGVDTPRIVALFREAFELLAADFDDDKTTALDQRTVELANGLTCRITRNGQWHGGSNYSIIARLGKGELPMPKATGGVKNDKGKVKRGDYVIIEHEGLVKALNEMMSRAEAKGQTQNTAAAVDTE